jgi:hypothetical protein
MVGVGVLIHGTFQKVLVGSLLDWMLVEMRIALGIHGHILPLEWPDYDIECPIL